MKVYLVHHAHAGIKINRVAASGPALIADPTNTSHAREDAVPRSLKTMETGQP